MPPPQPLKFITINDFSPGIWTASGRGISGGVGVPAPLGAAQASGTYRCLSIPGGGLGPAPRASSPTLTIPIPNADTTANMTYFNTVVSGFFTFGPVGPPSANVGPYNDDIFILTEFIKTDNTRRLQYTRLEPMTVGTPTDTLASINDNSNIANQYHGACLASTRVNPTAPYLTPGNPEVVAEWAPPGFAANKNIWLFPNPATPSVTSVVQLAARSGSILTHQGRIVLLEDNIYNFGARNGDATPTNENVSFTDPANSNAMGNQQQVFMQEYPNGYGAWGSQSAGELFLIKHQGGGVMISGDIASPTVTRFPGVTSSGGIPGLAAQTMRGMFYYSNQNGAWIWNGGNTAEKMSKQLQDDFILTSTNLLVNSLLLNRSYAFAEWGDLVLCTGGWVFDLNANSWWLLDNFTTFTAPQWVSRGYYSSTMWTCIGQCNPDATHGYPSNAGGIVAYNRSAPTFSYNWQSHPIPQSMDRRVNIREVVLVAQGSGTVIVTLTAADGTTSTATFTVSNTSQPQRMYKSAECQGYNVVVAINSAGTGGNTAAPVVYALHLGVAEAQTAAAA